MPFTEALNAALAEKQWQAPHLMAAMADIGVRVNQDTVERWLCGQNAPRLELLPSIARALDCTPNDLMGFDSPKAAASA